MKTILPLPIGRLGRLARIPSPTCRRGFSLVELLVTVAVIVLLAGLTLSLVAWSNRKTAVTKAESQLKLIGLKLQRYTGDVSQVPEGRDECGILIYKMLFGDGLGEDRLPGTADDPIADCFPDEGTEVYLAALDPHVNSLQMIQAGPDGAPRKVVDPFGHPWRYRAGKSFGTINPDFDLWSVGPDGVDGSADDIRNW